MSMNVQKAKGRSSSFKFDRGGAPAEFGPFIGTVKNNIDPTRSGRLQVYIEQFAGDDPDDDTLWRTVSYIPPFYGVTPRNNSSTSAGVGNFKGNQQSYGMWFTPPDIGVKVICFFVGGDPNQGFYLGCVPEAGVSHMVPAIGASRRFETQTELQKTQTAFADTKQLPVVEINVENRAIAENPRFFAETKPVHSYLFAILYNQGLLNDYIRGPISSSSQRESPSSVFGMITPGRPIYQGGLTDSDIKSKLDSGQINLQDLKIEGRRGGHSIVMDDGDLRGRDNLIRIRTAKGHQITMSDEADCFYFIHANGQTWIELGTEGTVDVYSTNSVNVRSQGEINLHADKNININAGENLNIRAKNVQIEGQERIRMNAITDITMYSQATIGVKSDGTLTFNSNGGGWKAGGSMALKAGRIDLNGGASPDSVEKVKPIVEYKLDDVKLSGTQGWEVQPASIETIVSRAPTHEPYPYHNRGVPVEIEIGASSAAAPSPAVQAAVVSGTADVPVTTPPPPSSITSPSSVVKTVGPESVTSAVSQAQAAANQAVAAAPSVSAIKASLNQATAAVPALTAGVPPGVAASIDAAAVLKTTPASINIGSINKTQVTGLLAQAKSAVGQASDAATAAKGIGQYGFKPEQLEASGFLKAGTVRQLAQTPNPSITDADIAEADRINAEGGDITPEQVAANRKLNAALSSPLNWTGQSGVNNLNSLLQNPSLQDKTQQTLLNDSLRGLQNAGLVSGTEPPEILGGLVQSASKYGVNSVDQFVKGVAPGDLKSSIGASIKGAQFSTNFVDNKLGSVTGLAKTATVASATVNRAGLDDNVKNTLGDPKIPAPEFKPQEREPEVPSDIAGLYDEYDKLLEEVIVFLDGVKSQFDFLIDESRVLDGQQPLTADQINQFAAKLDQVRDLYNNNRRRYLDPLVAFREDPANAAISDYMSSTSSSIARLITLLVGISAAQKALIQQWRDNAGLSS